MGKIKSRGYEENMGAIEDFKEILKEAERKHGSLHKVVLDAGVDYAGVHKWLNGKQKSLNLNTVAKILDFLKISIHPMEEEASKDVCFVNAKVVPAGEYALPPVAEDYIAAPLVGEVGAGPGYLPEDDIKSWFLVYKRLEAIRYRRNLIAVEIGRTSYSMQPTLNPGDIVLVDRDDRDVSRPGHMMLVMEPDSSGMVKRVSVKEKDDDFSITYYSDNAAKYPPVIYSLKDDFCDDWDKAIVGRVIWAWADVREK